MSLLSFFLQLPTFQFDIQVSLTGFHTSKFPGNVGIVRASFLDVSDGFGSEDSADSLLIFGVVLDDRIGGERHPS